MMDTKASLSGCISILRRVHKALQILAAIATGTISTSEDLRTCCLTGIKSPSHLPTNHSRPTISPNPTPPEASVYKFNAMLEVNVDSKNNALPLRVSRKLTHMFRSDKASQCRRT
ncbi:unnamed protein product [Didymodactylos carnosus]|uniref:Uncharacterized protein n=1 Tax=Didymodactylos carnosus TaxID=1234261 RepID=A0A816ACY1_9BILA|nr:unnamed protein product [Didymodactylos carnosus]CAF4466632.1 unnamed protein product [Didymodactylos carnosus]CAF4525632.1 unnamed protein product [Didymodactylos carnosus]